MGDDQQRNHIMTHTITTNSPSTQLYITDFLIYHKIHHIIENNTFIIPTISQSQILDLDNHIQNHGFYPTRN